MDRVQNTKLILWLITGIAAAAGITRFVFGLGATTNLTDSTPWGFWIGFDVMGGVALAAGGFVITAICYIMKRDEFHPLVRPAVLTAFLGYLAVVFGLKFDLGLPWNIWHMIIYWNLHSPLFEVGWCVMLYSSVLLLEFSPVPLEETSHYAKIRRFLVKLRLPLVFLGIMLSTLHQSSLGSLFLIMPFRLHALWYSSILPVMFFMSAVALGLMMVSLESLASHWLYRRKPESDLVAKLGKAVVWVLGMYLVVKLADIIISGEFGLIFSGTWESYVFIAEMLISVIVPMIIFGVPRLRVNPAGQWAGSIMVVFGMVFNRINVGGLTMLSATGDMYVPSWMELVVSAGVVSVAALVFLWAVERLHVWEQKPADPQAEPYAPALFDRSSESWLGTPGVAARTKYSLAFIFSLAIGFAIMPEGKIHSEGIEDAIAQKARGGDTLSIDGNRDDFGVPFDHKAHAARDSSSTSCATCHHMNMPHDTESGCWECHKAMYAKTDVSAHDWHSSELGANLECGECHRGGEERRAESAKECSECHKDLLPAGATIKVEQYYAPSYTDAMHSLCVGCHEKKAVEIPDKPQLALCTTCHRNGQMGIADADQQYRRTTRTFNRVSLPKSSVGDTLR